MIGIRPQPGGFAWFVLHELRLAWRSRSRGVSGLIGGALLLAYVGVGAIVAANLVDWRVVWSPGWGVAIFLATTAAFTLMVAQAILASQRTLYEMRDLDLLLTSPMHGSKVLSAKLAGIAASISLTYAVLLLPMVVPFALLGHPQAFGVVGLVVAIPMAAAGIGIAATLLLARTIGPRSSRTVGQILAALLGGGFYLTSQLTRLFHDETRGLFGWAEMHGFGIEGVSAWPGHAAFGSISALLGLLLPAMLLFALVGVLMQTAFLAGYQDGGARLVRPRKGGRSAARLFHASLRRAVVAKEWRLLRRDPALAFQIVLRLIYLLPLLLIGLRHGAGTYLAATLAFANVLITSQFAGSLAWLTILAEDAPDLLSTAPVDGTVMERAKLFAALAMTAPLAAIVPVAMVAIAPIGALVTLIATAVTAWCCALIELNLGKPGQRAGFSKRGRGSFVAGLLTLFVAVLFGGVAAVVTALVA